MASFFWLKYINNNAPLVPQYMRFNGTRNQIELDAKRITTEGKRGYLYAHTLYHREAYAITISADELWQESKIAYLEDFWKAHRWFIAQDDSPTQPAENSFVECVIPDGRMPVERLNNHPKLRQVSFEMTVKAPTV